LGKKGFLALYNLELFNAGLPDREWAFYRCGYHFSLDPHQLP
jgi:hypothetical protein